MGNSQSDEAEEEVYRAITGVPIFGPIIGLAYAAPRAIVYASKGDQKRVDSTGTEIVRRVAPGIYDHCSKGPWIRLNEIRSQVNTGDLVEINEGWFSHSVLYLGDGRVMSVDANGDKNVKTTKVYETSLESVCGGKPVRICNNDQMAERNFKMKPRSVSEIIGKAREYQGKTLHYEFDFRNCEYYATVWRFGKGFSSQVCRPTSTPNGHAFDGITGVAGFAGVVDIVENSMVIRYRSHDGSRDIICG